MVSGATSLDWSSQTAGETLSRLAALTSRLSDEYARSFKKNPPSVAEQLRSGAFLSNRSFDLADESRDVAVNWHDVIAAMRRLRGVNGIATPRVAAVGGNVLLATRHEAERAQHEGLRVDGFYDVREKDIKPLSPNLTPWVAPQVAAEPPAPSPSPRPELAAIATSLQHIDVTLERLVDLVGLLVQAVFRPDKRRK
jgi:hypothetical protein